MAQQQSAQGTQEVIERPEPDLVRFSTQVEQMAPKWADSLPRHIPVERFRRVVMTAIQRNPDLLDADRASLFLSCQQAATDGLMPDGREGALVIYNTKVKAREKSGKVVERWIEKVQWMPMIAGIRKKVRNSDEISDWRAEVVRKGDKFHHMKGDSPSIYHEPLSADGEVIAAYSIAYFKDGTISREVMMRADIDKVRKSSKAPGSPAWTVWFEEMAKKAVARRHSKSLPMSTDLDDLIRRDDQLYDFEGASDKEQAPARPQRGDFARISHDSAPDFQMPAREVETVEVEGEPAKETAKTSKAATTTKAPEESKPKRGPHDGKRDEILALIEAEDDPDKPNQAIEDLIRTIEDKNAQLGSDLRMEWGAKIGRLRKAAEAGPEAAGPDIGAEAEADGYAAFKVGKSLFSTPDEFRGELAVLERWKDGWRKAEFESRPKKAT